MALTFPRDLPYDPTERTPFIPVYQQSRALTGGGSPNVADLGPSMWRCEFMSYVGDRERFEGWVAWLNSLDGGLRMFKGRPPGRRLPLAHPRGFNMTYLGSPWLGLGNLSVIGAGRDTVTINQIPNGIIMQPGDYFSIPVGSRQHLFRVVEGATSSGNAISLSVRPSIPPGVTTGIAVRFYAPYCEMVLEGDFQATRRGLGGMVAFTGLQVLI